MALLKVMASLEWTHEAKDEECTRKFPKAIF